MKWLITRKYGKLTFIFWRTSWGSTAAGLKVWTCKIVETSLEWNLKAILTVTWYSIPRLKCNRLLLEWRGCSYSLEFSPNFYGPCPACCGTCSQTAKMAWERQSNSYRPTFFEVIWGILTAYTCFELHSAGSCSFVAYKCICIMYCCILIGSEMYDGGLIFCWAEAAARDLAAAGPLNLETQHSMPVSQWDRIEFSPCEQSFVKCRVLIQTSWPTISVFYGNSWNSPASDQVTTLLALSVWLPAPGRICGQWLLHAVVIQPCLHHSTCEWQAKKKRFRSSQAISVI